MPGVFSKSVRPKRPGAYFNFEATPRPNVSASAGSVVAVPFTHDWGPLEVAHRVESFSDFQSVYGATATTPGYKAVKQAFQGEGIEGRGGAGAVVAYRFGGSAAAKASLTLTNTTPVSAITLRARYEGTRGNALRVTTRDYAADSAKNELLLLDGALELERYVYADTNVQDLADQINANSDWITANTPVTVTGVALTAVSSSAFTGGNDGTTVASGDWTDVMTKLEVERFGVFVPYDLTDSAVLASLKTWAVGLNNGGKRFMTVVGGALAEDVATANTRSATLNDPNFINVGVGSYVDEELGALSTSLIAPRIAGILAARGEAHSITFGRLAGVSITTGATESNILSAFDGGTLVLSRDSDPDAPVRIEKALTTFTTTTDTARPYLIFRQPKYVRTMHGIEMEVTEWTEQHVIGQLQVGEKVREFIVGEIRTRIDSRVQNGVIQPNPTVEIDPDPPPTAEDEFVALRIGAAFGRSLEQVFFTVSVS